MSGILINGIVSARDFMPRLQMEIDGHVVTMSMAEARNVARDIEVTCARSEADAMIHKFFTSQNYPTGANHAIMVAFRDFRGQLDQAEVEKSRVDPDA